MPAMGEQERERFLSRPRFGILTSLRGDGWPVAVPVWFEWDGERVLIFTDRHSPKVRRLRADPRASLLVVNRPDEVEGWVAFDGDVGIVLDGDEALALAERLAPRFWDLDAPRSRSMLAAWRSAADSLCILELRPTRIRSFAD